MDRRTTTIINENLWNQNHRLSPQYRKYSHESHDFKKTVQNLDHTDQVEKEVKFQQELRSLLVARQTSNNRTQARKLERLIVQYKSNQINDEDMRQQVQQIEKEDPTLFEELAMRRKWTNVNKDPVKGMKDDFMNKNSYWGTLNHLPAKGVGKIVTDKILDMDRQTCDRILQNILQDKQIDDIKREQQQALR